MPFEQMPNFIVVEPDDDSLPLEVSSMPDMPHMHFEEPLMHDHSDGELEVEDPEDFEIVVDELPGAPDGTKDPELPETLEVSDDEEKKDDDKKDKKPQKWDWEARGPHGFVAWIQERLDGVPKHSGYDSAGLERAMYYLDKLDGEISRAMRSDLDGDLDADKIEEVRSKIDDGLSRLHDRLEKVKKSKKYQKKRSKADFELDTELVKEGQKITGVQGVYIMVPLLISRIARVCINGMRSAGHNLEDLYGRQVKKWNLNDREQAEVMQLLADMGYPLQQDRGYMPDDDLEVSDSDNFDWMANYKG